MGIYRVELNTLNNRTAGATDGYKDYACTLSTQLTPGLPYSITVETGVAAENVRVWIDYNNDGSFHPTGELFFSSDNQRVHTGATQLIPATAVQGKALRMRVAADYTNSPMPGPCTTPQYSQTEDYAVVLGANTQPPLADFTVETAQACAGSFRFVDRSQRGATAWEWDFGDGTRSTQQSPVHTYTTPGRYAVTLQACNANGCDSANDTTSAVFYARAPVSASCAPRTTAYCCGYGLTEVGIGDLLQRSADASAGYEDFSCTRRVTVTQTDAIPLLLRGGQNTAQSYWLYVDSNEDGQFSAAELVWQTAGSPRVETFFVLPEGVPVNRPLRLRVIADAAGSSPDACADRLNGQVEDYSLVVTPVTCPAPVRAGQLNRITLFTASNSSKRSVLMISNHSPGARIQWQTRESTTSNSTWKNEAGATLPVFSTVLPGGYYRRVRAVVSCGASSVVTKEVEMADITRFNYLHTTCGTTYISRVALAGTGLLAVSACEDGEGPGFSLRDPANPRYTATLRQGETYALQVTTSRSCRVSVFAAAVDGGDVRVGNRQILRVTAGVPTTVLVPIDSSWATSGTVLLRIRCDENALIPDIAVDEETVLGAGETEDYLVGVRPWQCAEPTQAGRITAPALVCGNTSTDLSVFGYSLGSRLQWQSSLDSVTWQDIAGAQSRELRQVVQQTTYFRVRVRGCSSSMYSPVARVTVRPHTACYCTGPTGTATTTGLTRVRMIGTSLDNASSGTGPALVAYAPNVPSRTATLIRGASYALDITISSGQAAAQPATLGAWLDADHSGTYDLLEWVQLLHLPSLQAGAATYRVLLPIASGAQLGETGLRLRISPDPLGYGDACAGSGGEVEEYLVQIAPAPCPAALTAGSVVAGSVLSCATVLRSESYSIGAALQWQVSRTQGSSWEDVPGATAAAFSLPFVDRPTAEYYRLQARCEGQVASSAAVIVPAGNCQTSCLSAEAGSSVSTQVYKLYVDDVILVGTTLANYGSGLNESRSSYGWKTTHIRWPVQVPNWTATVQRGGSYPLQLTLKGNGPMNTGVWADWNHDGQFSTGEYYGTAATSYGPVANLSFTLSVPATAALGSTVLRLRVCNVALEAQHGCASLGLQSSETEDYVLTVTDQPGPVLPTVVATPAVLCLNAPVRLEATNSGAGAVYSWLGPNGFRATGSSVTLPAATAASAGTYVVSAEQNGQRIVTSVYLPVASCLPTATQPSLLAAGLTIFPNPTTGYCTLQLPAELHSGVALQVRIRTPAGQLARELTGSATRSAQATGWELPLDLRLLPRGLYFVELLSPRGSVFGKILVE